MFTPRLLVSALRSNGGEHVDQNTVQLEPNIAKQLMISLGQTVTSNTKRAVFQTLAFFNLQGIGAAKRQLV